MATTYAPSRVLLIGGHGKVAIHMTPLMLSRNWHVISVIRKEKYKDDILEVTSQALAGHGSAPNASALSDGSWKDRLDFLIYDIETIKSPSKAEDLLRLANPDWVAFCAGAGAAAIENIPLLTAIDRDAACHIMSASILTPSITKIFVLSGIICRHFRPAWWDDANWDFHCKYAYDVFANWTIPKHQADEYITIKAAERYEKEQNEGIDEGGYVKGADGQKREAFTFIDFRPTLFVDDHPPTGRVSLGKSKILGSITRRDVAQASVELLAAKGVRGWIDGIQGEGTGEQEMAKEVQRVVASGEDAIDGEDLEAMKARVEKMEQDFLSQRHMPLLQRN